MKAFPSKNFIYFKDVKYLNLYLNSSISTYVNLGLDCFCVLGSVKPRATRKAEGGCEAWSSFSLSFYFYTYLSPATSKGMGQSVYRSLSDAKKNMSLRSRTLHWSMCRHSPNMISGPQCRTVVQVFFIHLDCRSEGLQRRVMK